MGGPTPHRIAEDTLSVWEVCDIVKDSGFSTLQSPTMATPKAAKGFSVSFDEEAPVPWPRRCLDMCHFCVEILDLFPKMAILWGHLIKHWDFLLYFQRTPPIGELAVKRWGNTPGNSPVFRGHPPRQRSFDTNLQLHHTQVEETRYDREILEDIRSFMKEEETLQVTWAGAVEWCRSGSRG